MIGSGFGSNAGDTGVNISGGRRRRLAHEEALVAAVERPRVVDAIEDDAVLQFLLSVLLRMSQG